jgi:two-component system cell cycle sensor histidine kinase/response regulator CckA
MKKTILVVEDDEGRRKAMVQVLTGAGYDVIAGEDFEAALQMVDRFGVDVMISDLQLSTATPHGQALARLAQRKRSPLKLLFVSRVPVAPDRTKARTGNVLPMPLDRSALLAKVRSLLAN